MEPLSFICGILSIIFIMFLIGIILGIVQIFKNKKRITELFHEDDAIYRAIESRTNDVNAKIEEIYQHIEVRIKDVYGENKSYIDSRVDKLMQNK